MLRPGQRSLLLTTAAVLLALLAVSPVAVADHGEDLRPVVSNTVVGPTSLPYMGGEVTISTEAADDHDDLVRVFAQVFGWDTSYQYVALTPTDDGTYVGSVVIPPNLTDSPVTYWVAVSAEDGAGWYALDADTEITVAARPQASRCPPRMPAWAAAKARCGRIPTPAR